MAAVRALSLWTAFLFLPASVAALPGNDSWGWLAGRAKLTSNVDASQHNALRRGTVPLNGTFSAPSSRSILTTTITPEDLDTQCFDATEAGDQLPTPSVIHTITIEHPSSSSWAVTPISPSPTFAEPPPIFNHTGRPPDETGALPIPPVAPAPSAPWVPTAIGTLDPPSVTTDYSTSPSDKVTWKTTAPCTPLATWEPMTVWSVVYTATTTFNGSIEDYTPPFPMLQIPTYCDDTTTKINFPTTATSARSTTLTNSVGFIPPPKPPVPEHGGDITSEPDPVPTQGGDEDDGGGDSGGGSGGGAGGVGGGGGGGLKPKPRPGGDKGKGKGAGGGDKGNKNSGPGKGAPFISGRPTITFITTDRNPSVVVPTTGPPRYIQSWHHRQGPAGNGNHASALPGGGQQVRAPPTFTVVADRSQVVINSHTFSDLQPGQSNTVTVGEGTFTIGPTAITGHGQTIKKPAPVPTDGSMTQAQASGTFVAGGQVLTAVGSSVVVIHSTTYTYGPGRTPETVVVDGDTIHLGPSGIILDGMTLGGVLAANGVTKYAIVGGATITEIQPSLIVIDGDTITVSSDMELTTTVVNDQTLVIGPDGLTHSSLTIPMAEAAVTTTFQPSPSMNNEFPAKTGGSMDKDTADSKHGGGGEDDDDDDDAGSFVRPDFAILALAAGIAIGVWELI
ncbi:hypothetical protein LIA77_07046 [Sarocladium implicatum]|nr:hypothetical protein LIA77_07046 [Sarocladium implicatum]